MDMRATTNKTEDARVVEIIRTVHVVGDGTAANPMQLEVSYWTKDGKLIAEMGFNDDPMNPLARCEAP